MRVLDWLLNQLQTNPFLVAGLATVAGFALRETPRRVFSFARGQLTTELNLYNDQSIYDQVDGLIAHSEVANNSRRLLMVESFDRDRDGWDWAYSLGPGWHLIWLGKTPAFVHRHVKDQADAMSPTGPKRQIQLKIYTIGRSHSAIRRIIDDAKRHNRNDKFQRIFYWSRGAYLLADRKRRRSLESVFIPDDQKQRILLDLDRFIKSRDEYHRRGDPYRRTYGLEGPPGTGKTTLAQTLAAHIGRDVYVINLSAAGSDEALQAAINMIDRNGVGLIEDIDANEVTKERVTAPENTTVANPSFGQPSSGVGGLTLSGVLNALDGVAAREGRILFVTSNHLSRLDAALVRPGRIDVIESICPIQPPEALQMAKHYWPEDDKLMDWCEREMLPLLPMPASRLREMLIERGSVAESSFAVSSRSNLQSSGGAGLAAGKAMVQAPKIGATIA